MSRELLPQTVKLTASELSWLAGSGVVVLNFCSATMYGLRTFLWSIGLVYYVGHPQPPQSYWARVYCGCQPGPTRVALHPGRMMEKPERQPYIHWTTFYDFEETRNIELCSYKTPPKFHEKTPREGRKERILRREREKKREILGLHPSGPTFSGFGPPPFGPHPSGPHPSGPHPSGPTFSRFGAPPFGAPPFGAPFF